jgi:hypothetical protein
MSIQSNIRDREYDKFRGDNPPNTKVAVVVENTSPISIEGEISISPIPPSTLEVKGFYNSITGIVPSSETNIITKVFSKVFYLSSIDLMGNNLATYKIYKNASLIMTRRTWWTDFNEEVLFYNQKFEIGDTLEVKVIHNRPDNGDFEARIIGTEVL